MNHRQAVFLSADQRLTKIAALVGLRTQERGFNDNRRRGR